MVLGRSTTTCRIVSRIYQRDWIYANRIVEGYALMFADYNKDYEGWDYIEGNNQMSIATQRYFHIRDLVRRNNNNLRIAAKSIKTGAWTKWKQFYEPTNFSSDGFTISDLRMAYDLHRGVLSNEIVAESDYPTYEENYAATRILGAVLEHKGFAPHYYYSGSKSIHIHLYLDWNCLSVCNEVSQDKIINIFKTLPVFKKKFLEWLRSKIITCWDMRCREFDEDLIRSTHLIRCEMSRNKFGYKTFLGYTHRDISFIPRICNEKNRIYPTLGKIKLSRPHNPQELIDEFLQDIDVKHRINKVKKKESNLSRWANPINDKELRPEIKFMLSDDFKSTKDGFKRAMFILSNDLKKVYGDQQALIILKDWNTRMGNPVRIQELNYRMKTKIYTLSTQSIKDFIYSLGHTNISRNH